MNSKKLPTKGYVGIIAIVTMILLAIGPMSSIAQVGATTTTSDTTLTSDEVNTKDNVEAMIQSIIVSVAAVHTMSDNADLRFSEVGFVEPNGGQAILVVECMPDENPTGTFELYAHGIESLYTFPVGLDGQNVALFSLVQNNGDERQAVAIGTFCIDEDNGGSGPAASRVVVRSGDDITNIIKNTFKFSNVVNNIVSVISNQTTTNNTNINNTNTNNTNINNTNTNNTVVIPPPVDNGTDTDGNGTDTTNSTDTTTPPVTNDTTTTTTPLEPRTENPTDNTTDATLAEETAILNTAPKVITPEELQSEGTPETPTAPVEGEGGETSNEESSSSTTTPDESSSPATEEESSSASETSAAESSGSSSSGDPEEENDVEEEEVAAASD